MASQGAATGPVTNEIERHGGGGIPQNNPEQPTTVHRRPTVSHSTGMYPPGAINEAIPAVPPVAFLRSRPPSLTPVTFKFLGPCQELAGTGKAHVLHHPRTAAQPYIHTYIQHRRTGASFPHTWEPPPPGSTHLSTPHPLFSFSSTSLPLLCPPPQFPPLPPFSTIPRIRRYFDNFRHEPRHRSSTLGFRSLSSISLPTSLCRLLSRSSTPTIV